MTDAGENIRMNIVRTKDVVYEYIRRDDEGAVTGITTALDHVTLTDPENQLLQSISMLFCFLRRERYMWTDMTLKTGKSCGT